LAVRIIYGGSIKPDNMAELMACEDIDGGLVGAASFEPGFVFGDRLTTDPKSWRNVEKGEVHENHCASPSGPITPGTLQKMKIVKQLSSDGFKVIDYGAYTEEPTDDYPDFAFKVARAVGSGRCDRGRVGPAGRDWGWPSRPTRSGVFVPLRCGRPKQRAWLPNIIGPMSFVCRPDLFSHRLKKYDARLVANPLRKGGPPLSAVLKDYKNRNRNPVRPITWIFGILKINR